MMFLGSEMHHLSSQYAPFFDAMWKDKDKDKENRRINYPLIELLCNQLKNVNIIHFVILGHPNWLDIM